MLFFPAHGLGLTKKKTFLQILNLPLIVTDCYDQNRTIETWNSILVLPKKENTIPFQIWRKINWGFWANFWKGCHLLLSSFSLLGKAMSNSSTNTQGKRCRHCNAEMVMLISKSERNMGRPYWKCFTTYVSIIFPKPITLTQIGHCLRQRKLLQSRRIGSDIVIRKWKM